MKRTDKYEQSKLMKVSTNKSVVNVYVDSFPIEKVKLQVANYETKERIDIYLDFNVWYMLRDTAMVGRLFKELSTGQKVIHRGGTTKSEKYNGAPESRVLTFGMLKDKVFVNASSGKGKLTDTGAIMPDGQPDVKVSVSMTVEDMIGMLSYTAAAIDAYMGKIVKDLLEASEKNRNEGV